MIRIIIKIKKYQGREILTIFIQKTDTHICAFKYYMEIQSSRIEVQLIM